MPREATRWHLLFLQKNSLSGMVVSLAFLTRPWMEPLSIQLPLSPPLTLFLSYRIKKDGSGDSALVESGWEENYFSHSVMVHYHHEMAA